MVVEVFPERFLSKDDTDAWDGELGPCWIDAADGVGFPSVPVSIGLRLFVRAVCTAVEPGEYAYGTVYAVKLSGDALPAGEWHYDMGRYTADGARRFVSTWRSDGTEIGNVFRLPDGAEIQAPNGHVTSFHEGSDYHRHPARPASDARGVFMSATLYRLGEVPNLSCPRLASLSLQG